MSSDIAHQLRRHEDIVLAHCLDQTRNGRIVGQAPNLMLHRRDGALETPIDLRCVVIHVHASSIDHPQQLRGKSIA